MFVDSNNKYNGWIIWLKQYSRGCFHSADYQIEFLLDNNLNVVKGSMCKFGFNQEKLNVKTSIAKYPIFCNKELSKTIFHFE